MSAGDASQQYGPEWELLESVCRGVDTPDDQDALRRLCGASLQWGKVLDDALRHRMLTLLADAIIRSGATAALPLRVGEHLRTVLALNRYRRGVWYRECGRVVEAFRAVQVDTAVRKGGAYEPTIYRGDGRRWMGDIDLLIRARDHATVVNVLQDLGYEQGLYDFDAEVIVPFGRVELIRYKLNPDHLPTYTLCTGDPLVPVLEVDCATSLTWARSPYQVPVDDMLATLDTVEAGAGTKIAVPCALPAFQFLDTVLHLFREAWFDWWLEKEQDVDLMKFGDVLRLARAYLPDLTGGRFQRMVLGYGVAQPVSWVLEHLDRTFGTRLVKEFGLTGNTTESFLASAAVSGPDVAVWHADMRARLHATDRRHLLTGV